MSWNGQSPDAGLRVGAELVHHGPEHLLQLGTAGGDVEGGH